MKTYAHIVRAFLDRPWAIRPEKLAAIQSLLALRVSGGAVSAEEVREIVAAAGPRRQASRGKVGILPLQGVIMHRAGMMAETSGAVSLESWMQSFRAFIDDPEIDSLVIDVDSPGGSVEGVPEAAAEIRAARDRKPITAIANTTAASAAYWIAAQASEIVVTPSGWVGSIGVYSTHEDWSGAYEQMGVQTTLISAGKYKVEGNEFEPLSDEARAHMQSMVDDYYGMFLSDVAKGRNVPVSTVRTGYGEGRMLLAKDAKAAGMVDRIDTFDGTLGRLLPKSRTQPAALGPGWQEIGAVMEPPAPDPVPDPPETPEPAVPDTAAELELRRYRHRAHVRR